MRICCAMAEGRWEILQKYFEARQLWLLVRVLCFGTIMPALKRLGWVRLQSLLERRFPDLGETGPLSAPGRHILQGIDDAFDLGRPFICGACLCRGLSRYYFLRRAGIDVALCFGIPLRDHVVSAGPGHCWLEYQGKPILEKKDPRDGFITVHRFCSPASKKYERSPRPDSKPRSAS